MQTDYLFHGIKGFERFAYCCYRYAMASTEANRRYKMVLFYQKYGLDATLEAFDISKRTLYRYQSILKKSNNNILSLEPKSKTPKQTRTSQVPKMKGSIERYKNSLWIFMKIYSLQILIFLTNIWLIDYNTIIYSPSFSQYEKSCTISYRKS